MSKSTYRAICWAEGKTDQEIKDEIARCNERYYKPYPWNGVEFAQYTLDRIFALEKILADRGSKDLTNV